MRKWLWGGIPLVFCAAAGAFLYARHLSAGARVPQVIKVVGEIAEVGRPIPLANPETTTAMPAVNPLPPAAPEPDVVEPIVVENRDESPRVVQPFRTGQIFVVGAEEA